MAYTLSGTTDHTCWANWNCDYYTMPLLTNSTSVATTTWTAWNTAYTPNTITVTTTWQEWNNVYVPYAPCAPNIVVPAPVPAEVIERQRAVAEKRRLAVCAARELLMGLLDEEQQKQFEARRCFELRVEDRIYRIKPGSSVEQINPEGRVITRFCIHPREYVPSEDEAIAQKLLLETDEKEFLRIANASAA